MIEFRSLPDLASERLGGRAVFANDEFFAPKESLVRDALPTFDPERYTDRGKWMDGWETRRRREPGHDWCVIQLGLPGLVRGVVIDTRHFRGNHPARGFVDGCELEGPLPTTAEEWASLPWRHLVDESPLIADCENGFRSSGVGRVTHARLSIVPDGGVARLRVHGVALPDPACLRQGPLDLAAIENGGAVIGASDAFFGAPQNLLLPGAPRGMRDGWETRRRRGPGHDWVVIRLGAPGVPRRVEVDTRFFRGNYPESCSVDVVDHPGAGIDDVPGDAAAWHEALSRRQLGPDRIHVFDLPGLIPARTTHVRLNAYPDGGVARLRVWCDPV